jgi:regulator of protease activity HflC (stomatin/prohibitin superfamily)
MLAVIIVLVIVAILFTLTSVKIVPQSSVKVIERLGRYHYTAGAGLNVIIPFFDSVRGATIDMREQIMRTQKQPVITRDNVTMQVDCVVYWQILDAVKATYEIEEPRRGLDQMALSSLRNVIGEMDLDHTLTSRDLISTKIRAAMDESTDRWGVKVTRVELMDIEPPPEIKLTMEKQMTAERTRRALVTEAEGAKQSAILRAEGEKQAAIIGAEGAREAAILRADGEGQAILAIARGESSAIEAVSSAVKERGGDPMAYLIAVKYLQTLGTIAGDAQKTVFLPYESSALMSSLGSMREMFSASEKR